MKLKDDYNHIYDLCKDHMHSYVLAEMVDGTKMDGIITGLDEEYVYFALPIECGQESLPATFRNQSEARQFGYGYHHGYGNYGYPGYGYPGYRPRPRFRRFILPLAALTALSVLPWY